MRKWHKHGSQYNEQRYEVLKRLGVQINEIDGMVSIMHKEYRKAMLGLDYLCQAPDSKYKLMNYLRLDYKNAYAKSPLVEDILKTLPSKSVEAIKRLEENMAGIKIRTKLKPLRGIVSDFKWKVEYSYKGKSVCGFYADYDSLMMCVYFNKFSNITEFATTLYEEDMELFQWFQKQFPERLCKCPNNRRVYFAKEARRICGLSNRTETVNPTEEDIENIVNILKQYHCGII